MTDSERTRSAGLSFADFVANPDPLAGLIVTRGPVAWQPVVMLVAMHLGALAACIPSTFSWGAAAMFPLFWWIASGLGMYLGYHRLITHRSFKTSKFLERSLATFGVLNMTSGPVSWAGIHRLHHAESDGDHDPHSPRHGLAWSHILWGIHDRSDGRRRRAITRDLMQDPYFLWLERWYLLPQTVLAALLFGVGYWATGTAMGALGYVIWGVCVRTVFGWHTVWSVKSAAHRWGYRNFSTDDDSRNNWWVALLTFGEGWHNNHHAQQRSAAHGMRWWEFDPTWWTILLLERLGLAHSVVRPKRDRLDSDRGAPRSPGDPHRA